MSKEPRPKKTGRPCKLTDELQQRIIDAMHHGAYIETASAYAGINKETLYRWLKLGARARDVGKKSKFTAFSNAIERAMADCELRDLETIGLFARGLPVEVHHEKTTVDAHGHTSTETKVERRIERHWTAAAWRLERKHPERWGRKMELSGPGGEPLKPAVVILPSNGRDPELEGKGEERGDADADGS